MFRLVRVGYGIDVDAQVTNEADPIARVPFSVMGVPNGGWHNCAHENYLLQSQVYKLDHDIKVIPTNDRFPYGDPDHMATIMADLETWMASTVQTNWHDDGNYVGIEQRGVLVNEPFPPETKQEC